jgi:hypothetical protein
VGVCLVGWFVCCIFICDDSKFFSDALAYARSDVALRAVMSLRCDAMRSISRRQACISFRQERITHLLKKTLLGLFFNGVVPLTGLEPVRF